MEIGTWSNEMADSMAMDDNLSNDDWGILPPNIKMCSRDRSAVVSSVFSSTTETELMFSIIYVF